MSAIIFLCSQIQKNSVSLLLNCIILYSIHYSKKEI
nr:MAG TPA: hypothetical protein [Caudoviricetes sp.]